MGTPGLLVLEGNVNRLRREGKSQRLEKMLVGARALEQRGELRFKHMRFASALDVEMAQAFAQLADQYDGVLVVGHSDPSGIEVADNLALSWSAVGTSIAYVQPRAVLLFACMGISAGPATELFSTIPTLKHLGGSPAKVSLDEGMFAILELIGTIFGKTNPETSTLLSLLNTMTTGGVVGWRRRDKFEAASVEELVVNDIILNLAKEFLSPAPRRSRRRPRRPNTFQKPEHRARARRRLIETNPTAPAGDTGVAASLHQPEFR